MLLLKKTPRVKLLKDTYAVSVDETDAGATAAKVNAWISGRKGSDGFDLESREWCDKMLILLGYDLS